MSEKELRDVERFARQKGKEAAQPLPLENKMPERIWLQWYGEDDLPHDADTWKPDLVDVTWCKDQINTTDPGYIRADLVEAKDAALAAEKAKVNELVDELEDMVEVNQFPLKAWTVRCRALKRLIEKYKEEPNNEQDNV